MEFRVGDLKSIGEIHRDLIVPYLLAMGETSGRFKVSNIYNSNINPAQYGDVIIGFSLVVAKQSGATLSKNEEKELKKYIKSWSYTVYKELYNK